MEKRTITRKTIMRVVHLCSGQFELVVVGVAEKREFIHQVPLEILLVDRHRGCGVPFGGIGEGLHICLEYSLAKEYQVRESDFDEAFHSPPSL